VPVRTLPVLDARPPRPEVGPAVALLKVLADEHRLAILALLARGELCVCHLMEILDLPQSTVSRHVGVLKRAGLVQDRRDERDGRWTHYRLTPAAVAELQGRLATLLALGDASAEAAARPSPPCPE
jgi:ArsR family transcriptional regulator, arsenate/arsenite/antimonite-responsive transcriptional repressor